VPHSAEELEASLRDRVGQGLALLGRGRHVELTCEHQRRHQDALRARADIGLGQSLYCKHISARRGALQHGAMTAHGSRLAAPKRLTEPALHHAGGNLGQPRGKHLLRTRLPGLPTPDAQSGGAQA
jgi:hypothetical protein